MNEFRALSLVLGVTVCLRLFGGGNGLSFNTDKGMLLSSWPGARPQLLSEWYSGEVTRSFCPLQTSALFLISSDNRVSQRVS